MTLHTPTAQPHPLPIPQRTIHDAVCEAVADARQTVAKTDAMLDTSRRRLADLQQTIGHVKARLDRDRERTKKP